MCIYKIIAILTLVFVIGCKKDEMSPPTSFRFDLVPLRVVMTDYVMEEGGEKLFKIQGSAQLFVPLAGCEPKINGKCYEYTKLPRPKVDVLSAVIDKQVLLQNDRGLFTSRSSDSKRINELRAEASRRMVEIAGSETHVHLAMRTTADVLRQYYEKFGYKCSIEWD